MRRRVGGVGAIQKQQLAQAKFKDKGTEIAEDQVQQLSKQMDSFRTNLQDFATKHANDIRKNPQFRRQFQEMCATVGVDPLASSKGIWAKLLGVGDFYYELGVQIIEVCLATSHRNGGIMELDELRERVARSRNKKQEVVTNDDLLRAIEKLKVLGEGFRVIPTGKSFIVQSVAAELSMDHTRVIQVAEPVGFITISSLMGGMQWGRERATKIVDDLVKEGMVWVDDQAGERQYWFPGFVKNLADAN